MGMGFGISSEDVHAVLMNKGVIFDENNLEHLFQGINGDLVEKVALNASDELEDQTMAAYDEIWRQLQGTPDVSIWRASQNEEKLEKVLPEGIPPRPRPRV